MTTHGDAVETSMKSRGVALALAAILGPFGAHRFCVGRPKSGTLMLTTLGGLGVWYLYDLIMVVAGEFEDADRRRLLRWDPADPPRSDDLAREVESLGALGDFRPERLLAQAASTPFTSPARHH